MNKSVQIPNFCDGSPIEVQGYSHPEKSIGAIVSIQQRVKSMSFQHDMTPEQARDMAKALLEAADAAEQEEAARNRREVQAISMEAS